MLPTAELSTGQVFSSANKLRQLSLADERSSILAVSISPQSFLHC